MTTPKPPPRRIPAPGRASTGPRGPASAASSPRGSEATSRGGPAFGSHGNASAPRGHTPAKKFIPPVNPARVQALFMPCATGVEVLLADEAKRILGAGVKVLSVRGGVEVQADGPAQLIDCVFKLNLESRLAQRVLWRVAVDFYRHEDDLYGMARQIDWTDWITPQHTLRVDVTARNSPLRTLNFPGLRIKDAVCDVLRDATGERPSVDTWSPDLGLVLHLDETQAFLYIDTSGEALFKRGWREDVGEAPLKETLAAAMLAAAGWQGRPEDGALLDPCCGAGTIPIEAAQIACDIAPGLLRHFAFENLLPFAPYESSWNDIRQAAKARQRAPQVAIYAGDVSFRMTDFATRNAERAGVLHAIEFKTGDALQRPAPVESGLLMFNPPYGERIDPKGTGQGGRRTHEHEEPAAPRSGREQFDASEADDFFQRLAAHWKRQYTGWTAWILSPDMKLPSAMRFKESRRVVLFNGPIECRLFKFDLIAGSNKAKEAKPDSESPAQP